MFIGNPVWSYNSRVIRCFSRAFRTDFSVAIEIVCVYEAAVICSGGGEEALATDRASIHEQEFIGLHRCTENADAGLDTGPAQPAADPSVVHQGTADERL